MSDIQSETESARKAAARLSRAEARAAVPAIFVDSWSTLIWPGHIRIVLGEWLMRKTNYRAAFVMTLEDAKDLAEIILKQVAVQQKEDAEPLELATVEEDSTPETEA